MEYGIETIGQNPQVITLLLVAIICIVALLALFALSRLMTGRKGLDKDRLALDAELYRLEKYASLKKKEQMGDKESRAESFWPKEDNDQTALAEAPAEVDQSDSAHESRPAAERAEEEEDEFADIRRENLVRDWNEND